MTRRVRLPHQFTTHPTMTGSEPDPPLGEETTPKHPEALRHLIPPEKRATNYVNRHVHGHEDFQMLDYARMEGINVLLDGPTGSGKTQLVQAYAAARQIPCVIVTAHSAGEPSQLFGKYVLLNGEMVWVDGLVTTAARWGSCVVLFDEINFYPPGVTAMVHPLLDDQRRIVLYDHVLEQHDPETDSRIGVPDVVNAGDDVLFVAAFNEGYRGTEELNEAFRNRFPIVVEWSYDDEVEDILLGSPTLRNIANEIRSLNEQGEIETPCSTNRLQFFEQMVDDIGLDAAISNFLATFTRTERDAIGNVFNLNRTRLWNDYNSFQKHENDDPSRGRFVTDE